MSSNDPFDISFDYEKIKRRSVNEAMTTVVVQTLKFIMQFGSTIALTRLLDPAQFGLVTLIAPLLGLIQIFNDLGFGQAVVQGTDINQRQVSALFWINLAISIGLTVFVMLLSPLIGWIYGDPRLLPMLLVSAPLIVLAMLSVLPGALLSRQMQFLPLAIIDVSSVAAAFIVGVAAACADFGYWSLVFMQIANAFTAVVLTWYFAGWRPLRPATEAGLGSLVRFGANITGSNLASYLTSSADNILVGLVDGKVALGIYDRGYKLVVQPLSQVMVPISRVAVPLLSRLTEAPKQYSRAYFQIIQVLLLASSPGLIFAIIAAKPLILLLFGPKWAAAAPVFAWICVGGLAVPVYASASWIFTSQNRTGEQLFYAGINSAVSVCSFAVGVFWGVVEVALCAALSYVFIQTPLLIWAATRSGPISLSAICRTIASYLAAGTTSAAVLSYLHLDQYGTGGLLATVLLSYVIFAVILAFLPGGTIFYSSMLRFCSRIPLVARVR